MNICMYKLTCKVKNAFYNAYKKKLLSKKYWALIHVNLRPNLHQKINSMFEPWLVRHDQKIVITFGAKMGQKIYELKKPMV